MSRALPGRGRTERKNRLSLLNLDVPFCANKQGLRGFYRVIRVRFNYRFSLMRDTAFRALPFWLSVPLHCAFDKKRHSFRAALFFFLSDCLIGSRLIRCPFQRSGWTTYFGHVTAGIRISLLISYSSAVKPLPSMTSLGASAICPDPQEVKLKVPVPHSVSILSAGL